MRSLMWLVLISWISLASPAWADDAPAPLTEEQKVVAESRHLSTDPNAHLKSADSTNTAVRRWLLDPGVCANSMQLLTNKWATSWPVSVSVELQYAAWFRSRGHGGELITLASFVASTTMS